MINVSKSQDGTSRFEMCVRVDSTIDVLFSCLKDYLISTKHLKKVIFIDPIVLSCLEDLLMASKDLLGPQVIVPHFVSESSKGLDSLVYAINLFDLHAIGRRGDLVLAIGGGALLDSVAFAASIYRRGVRVVKIPTTLLGLVDAGIGIKTGVNFNGFRNRLGTYHLDYTVLIDPQLMYGLSPKLLREGIGEILKIAVIKSLDLFQHLEREGTKMLDVSFWESAEGKKIIDSSIYLMLQELQVNPREHELMRCVDFGHTFSPLVEMRSLEGASPVLPHGYAVAFDCCLSSIISRNRALIDDLTFSRIRDLYLALNFDFDRPDLFNSSLCWASFVEMTKHRGGNQNLPLPCAIGKYLFVQDVDFDELERAVIDFRAEFVR